MTRSVALVALLLSVLFVLAGCDGDGNDVPSPSPAPTETGTTSPGPSPSASPAPTGTAQPGVPVFAWSIRAPQALPQDMVVYLERGCWQCDGPAEALERTTSIGNPGAVEVETRELFRAPGGPPAYILSFVSSPDGHEIWLTVCSRGYCGAVGEPTADAQVTVYHSDDGGITWSPVETFDGMVGIVTVAAGIPILARTERDASGNYVTTYFSLQGGRELRGPDGAYPLWGSNGDRLAWQTEDGRRLLRSDGSVIFESETPFFVLGVPHPDNDIFYVQWRRASPAASARSALVDRGVVVAEYDDAGPEFFLSPGAWLDERTAIGNAGFLPEQVSGASGQGQRNLPVLIDFVAGTVTPLTVYGPDFWSDAYRGRNRVWAADRGTPTAQTPYVVDADGDCLNVREQPSLSASVVRCWVDGVVLWAPGKEPIEAEGVTWIAVEGPDGSSGWASAEFLRR